MTELRKFKSFKMPVPSTVEGFQSFKTFNQDNSPQRHALWNCSPVFHRARGRRGRCRTCVRSIRSISSIWLVASISSSISTRQPACLRMTAEACGLVLCLSFWPALCSPGTSKRCAKRAIVDSASGKCSGVCASQSSSCIPQSTTSTHSFKRRRSIRCKTSRLKSTCSAYRTVIQRRCNKSTRSNACQPIRYRTCSSDRDLLSRSSTSKNGAGCNIADFTSPVWSSALLHQSIGCVLSQFRRPSASFYSPRRSDNR